MGEKVLDAENWRLEATSVIKDIENHVKSVEIVDGTDQFIYFNLTTKENKNYCIELSASGFRIVGNKYNDKTIDNDEYFETPYGLLNAVSPLFQQSFGNELVEKLNLLSKT